MSQSSPLMQEFMRRNHPASPDELEIKLPNGCYWKAETKHSGYILDQKGRYLTDVIGRTEANSLATAMFGNVFTFAWLVELPPYDAYPAQWWHPVDSWVRDAFKALKFSTKDDAETFINVHLPNRHAIATEHGFEASEAFLGSAEPQLHIKDEEIAKLRREVEYLRRYGSKLCTKMADQAMVDEDFFYANI